MNYSALFDEVVSSQNRRAPLLPANGALFLGPTSFALSPEQQTALSAPINESAIIVAGAGAGKTRLLVERAARLIREGADPKSIAVVTFTRKAAKEVQDRLALRLGSTSRLPDCSTVHALALREIAQQHGMPRIAADEVLIAVLDTLKEEAPSDYEEMSSNELSVLVNRCREEENYAGVAGILAARFEEILQEKGLTDFTSLMTRALSCAVPRYRHIIVDEAQDLSRLQKSLLLKFALPSCAFWFVGDPDQAIYAFRGAHEGMMQELEAYCGNRYVLTTNYRCATTVVAHANNVIGFSANRIPVRWVAAREDAGTVGVEYYEHGVDELSAVTDWLRAGREGERVALARTQVLVAPLKALGLPALSVHESKGLEWESVWLLGCEASLFPHILCGREEERRLFYVAMTRARNNLVMSYAASRSSGKSTRVRSPSPFLFEAQSLEA